MIKTKKSPSKNLNIKDYPKLMENVINGNVFLMTSEYNGTCIVANPYSGNKCGDVLFFVDPKLLRDYNEELTLQNV